jgi:hypothetical protein
MEKKEEPENKGSYASAVVCGIAGALFGAATYHFLKKEPMQQNPHSGYVIFPQLILGIFRVVSTVAD